MKKVATIFLALLLIIPAYAHGGRTDSQGGHYDRSTGEYHFHHGYPAHQHVNGTCPYNFDDKTGENSGTSSGGSSVTNSGGSSKPVHSSAATDGSPGLSIPIPAIVVGGFIGFYVLLYLFADISNKIQTRKYKRQWDAKRKELLDLYGGKTKRKIASECGMPDDMEIGPDGLPKEVNSSGWGDSLTFYVSPSGQAYHRRPTCTKSASIPTHATKLGSRRPCSKCFPCAPNMEWYWAYRRIIKQLEEYKVNTLDETVPPNAIICLKKSGMLRLPSKRDMQ